nr:hypothetical protein CFP56_24037 [Quercus suber]
MNPHAPRWRLGHCRSRGTSDFRTGHVLGALGWTTGATTDRRTHLIGRLEMVSHCVSSIHSRRRERMSAHLQKHEGAGVAERQLDSVIVACTPLSLPTSVSIGDAWTSRRAPPSGICTYCDDGGHSSWGHIISNPPRRHDAACTCISPPGPMLVSTAASRLWPAGGRRGWRAPTLAEIRTQHGRHADGRGGGGMCKQIGPQLDFRGSVELDHRLGSTPDRRRIHYLASDRFTSYAVDCCPGSSHALRGDALGDVGGASHLLAQQGAMRAR